MKGGLGGGGGGGGGGRPGLAPPRSIPQPRRLGGTGQTAHGAKVRGAPPDARRAAHPGADPPVASQGRE